MKHTTLHNLRYTHSIWQICQSWKPLYNICDGWTMADNPVSAYIPSHTHKFQQFIAICCCGPPFTQQTFSISHVAAVFFVRFDIRTTMQQAFTLTDRLHLNNLQVEFTARQVCMAHHWVAIFKLQVLPENTFLLNADDKYIAHWNFYLLTLLSITSTVISDRLVDNNGHKLWFVVRSVSNNIHKQLLVTAQGPGYLAHTFMILLDNTEKYRHSPKGICKPNANDNSTFVASNNTKNTFPL